ncbi:tannase/feruloyl esterase family alpha/beta hydrolase [Actinomadura sp. LOL_016]|uniref:tannase/feruloyl esterase family alpha/beta hydrolase n=1 Tax=unclassified Actinomadura TaxID=2626254 RepID=UPI003A7F6CCD
MRRTIAVMALTATALSGIPAVPPAAAAGPVTDAAVRCPSLAGLPVPAAAIGLPSRGGEVVSATLDRNGFCLVRGTVRGFDPEAPDIELQVNLPTSWNRKSVQFGGSGFNGTVVTGLDVAPGFVNTDPAQGRPPIDRGYATFGSDGGTDPSGSFALNEEAMANFAGESVKRTRDAAMAIIRTYYNAEPGKQYYVGGSKGGHEGLVAAQRYGADYDGIIAYYPAIENQAMMISWHRMWKQAYSPGGYLDPADQQLVTNAVYRTCDKLDGTVDGLISNVRGCDKAFSMNSLRCRTATSDTCLTRKQIRTMRTASSRHKFAFPLANGVTEMGPYPFLRGADLDMLLDREGNAEAAGYLTLLNPVIRYFIMQDGNASTANFDYREHEKRVKQLSRLLATTDPDVDRFARDGGKLIIVQGTLDVLVPAELNNAYYERMAARYGPSIRDFARYYVQPGLAHATGRFDLAWDSLTALDDWASRDEPPVNPVATDAVPANEHRTRPLCEYPLWPKYKGHGDVDQAKNFSCAGRR